MADPFVAEVRIVGFNFAPRGWALCNGQSLPTTQNTGLYTLLGTRFGGDSANFNLPDLQQRVAVGTGSGPGLSPRATGETGGVASVTLTEANMPSHAHTLSAVPSVTADVNVPSASVSLGTSSGGALYDDEYTDTLAAASVSTVGGGSAHNNLQPYLAVNFIMAMSGVYPALG